MRPGIWDPEVRPCIERVRSYVGHIGTPLGGESQRDGRCKGSESVSPLGCKSLATWIPQGGQEAQGGAGFKALISEGNWLSLLGPRVSYLLGPFRTGKLPCPG